MSAGAPRRSASSASQTLPHLRSRFAARHRKCMAFGYAMPTQVQVDSQPRWDLDARPPSPYAVQAGRPDFRVHSSSEDAPFRAYREPPHPTPEVPGRFVHATPAGAITPASQGVRARSGYTFPPHAQAQVENRPQWDEPMPNYAQFVRPHNQRSVSP